MSDGEASLGLEVVNLLVRYVWGNQRPTTAIRQNNETPSIIH